MGPIDQGMYSSSLTTTLRACCYEDVTEHGRLLAIKDILASLTEGNQLEEEQLVCFYAKDIAVARGVGECEKETIDELINALPDRDEVQQVIERR